MANRWIVVADAKEARMYEKNDDVSELKPGRRLENPALRVFGNEADLPPYWRRRFARELSALLEHNAVCGEYDDLIVAAPEHFLQLVMDSMGPAARLRLRGSVAAALTKLGGADLEARLAEIADTIGR